MKTARRLDHIEPFYVMECAKAAVEIARSPACDPALGGEPMIFLNIGEPDFTAPPRVQDAADRALRSGRTQYTDATGLPALRERISAWYADRFGLDIASRRIVVTAGASAALQLACLALVDRDDEVLLPDPSYPCNRHFVAAAEGRAVLLPASAADRFQPSAAAVDAAWTPRTRGVLLASPSNPTGTSIDPAEMGRIAAAVRARGGFTLVDEIYLGLSFDERYASSALAHGDDIVSINSFSKYFSMTGWRLGWLVVPDALVPAVEKLAQNLYICPSTVAQHAALACFEPESIAEYERRREQFRARRDFLVPALNAIGLTVPVLPDGAFYAWADVSAFAASSWDFTFDLMRRAHVAVTPGRDFGAGDGRTLRPPVVRELDGALGRGRLASAARASVAEVPAPENFRFRLRVYWEDTDAGGIVFYANYLKFFERARTEWLRSLGFGQERLRHETGTMFVVTDTAVRYLRPGRLDDLLDVTVRLEHAGRAQMTIAQQAWKVDAGPPELLAEGTIRIGCVDTGTFRPPAHSDCRRRELLADRVFLTQPAPG